MGAVFNHWDMIVVCIALTVFGLLYLTEEHPGWKIFYMALAGILGGAVLATWILGG